MRYLIKGLLAITLATPAFAKAPDHSLHPVARPVSQATPDLSATPESPLAALSAESRPAPRPQISTPEAAPDSAAKAPLQQAGAADTSPLAVSQALRPTSRPASVVKAAIVVRQKVARGAICGDPALQGEHVGPVPGSSRGCGIDDAVRLRSVNGIKLSQSAMIDCTTAKTLKRWIDTSLTPAIGVRGGGVTQINVAAHYVCRSRNNQPGAKISEHAKGHAIDISGFQMRDGTNITVLDDWDTIRDGLLLRKLHKAACGPFGTVLGPGSDGFHKDHFHFDTARYRSGSYCR
ncbi:hypothetical protein P775_07585 [Puniceibacterium antarcticum]|uniref:Extensin-like C-terminal domain-containing protein n=1 Tax=Puniceibacterium antarcticum TaxID=1206336 RepID=A0A2G8RGV0_9RHOB|nr:extensin family protein [Puniceibacterium antarcticum]PIL20826.1 hypothetical protein P775_07585 [Puniceibacterium antarcticum]